MKWIFEDEVLDVDQAFLEVIIECLPVSLFFCFSAELFDLALFLGQVSKTILLLCLSGVLVIIIGLNACLVVVEVNTLCSGVSPGRTLNLVRLLHGEF